MILRKSLGSLALATLGIGAMPSLAGAVTFSYLPSDAPLINSPPAFVAESRTGGQDIYQIDLGANTSNPQNTTPFNFQSGVAQPFTLSYDGSTKLATYTVGSTTLNYTNTSSTPITDIDIRTLAAGSALPGGSAVVTPLSLTVNGTNIAIPSGTNSTANSSSQVTNWDIGGLASNSSFTLTGNTLFTFTGSLPSRSDLSTQINIGSFTAAAAPGTPVPEPATMSLMSLGVGALAWSTLRRRRRV